MSTKKVRPNRTPQMAVFKKGCWVMAIKEILLFYLAPWYAVLCFYHQYLFRTHQTTPLSKNKILLLKQYNIRGE